MLQTRGGLTARPCPQFAPRTPRASILHGLGLVCRVHKQLESDSEGRAGIT